MFGSEDSKGERDWLFPALARFMSQGPQSKLQRSGSFQTSQTSQSVPPFRKVCGYFLLTSGGQPVAVRSERLAPTAVEHPTVKQPFRHVSSLRDGFVGSLRSELKSQDGPLSACKTTGSLRPEPALDILKSTSQTIIFPPRSHRGEIKAPE